MGMTIEQAWFVLEHGSAEGLKVYLEAIKTIKKNCVDIVRCKDCIYWDKGHTEECDNLDSVCFHNGWCKPDWFCSGGKRRDNDA